MKITLRDLKRLVRESLGGTTANRRSWQGERTASQSVDWSFLSGPVDQALDSARRETMAAARSKDVRRASDGLNKAKTAAEHGLEIVDTSPDAIDIDLDI